jgi:hypothetical protein
VVYPRSIPGREAPRRYTFPVSRLSPPPENGFRQAALSEFVGGWVATDE